MKHERLWLRDNAAPIERRDAAMRPSTFRDGSVEAIIATGADVRRRDARGEYIERLSIAGADLSQFRGASVLDAHMQGGVASVLGTIDDVRVEGDSLIARIRFSDRPEIAGTVRDVQAGILNSVSVGYEVREWADGTDPSTGLRTRTAIKWTPREVSFVPIAADPAARTRHNDLPLAGRALINREIRSLAQQAGVAASVVDLLIDSESSLDAARAAILNDAIARSQVHTRASHNRSTLDDPENFRRAAVEGLYVRVAPTTRPSPEARQFVGLTLPELARVCLHRASVSTQGLSPAQLVTRALGMQSTSDFPQILSDTVGRTMRDSYASAPSGIRRLARETTAPDFRAKHRLQIDAGGVLLEATGEHGEFKSGSFVEGGESYKLSTFGKIIGFSRQAIVNDDLAAFSDVARRLGQQAAAFENQFLVDLLVSQSGLGPDMSDANPLFDAAHGNLATSGGAPSDTTLPTARLSMRKQVGIAGELIDVAPWAVLVPPDLETATEKLLTAIQATTTDDVNPFSRLQLIVEPRLKDAKAWYVVADPAAAGDLEYSYLAGASGPQTETQLGFDIDGIRTKVRLDFGAGFVGWQGWYRNPGQ